MWNLSNRRRLRRMRCGRVAKRLPHIHHRQADAARLLLAQPVVELRHTRLGPVLAAEPDRPSADQVAHHDSIGMAPADGDLVDAYGLRPRRASLGQLRRHVLLLQGLHRAPVEVEFQGQVLDRRRAAASPHVVGKALGIERVVGQEIEPFALHCAATLALHTPDLELQVDTRVAARQIANAAHTPVVPARLHAGTAAAGRFFERRTRLMTRAFGSPNTPRTVGCGRKPRNAYASHSRRARFAELGIRT